MDPEGVCRPVLTPDFLTCSPGDGMVYKDGECVPLVEFSTPDPPTFPVDFTDRPGPTPICPEDAELVDGQCVPWGTGTRHPEGGGGAGGGGGSGRQAGPSGGEQPLATASLWSTPTPYVAGGLALATLILLTRS